MGDDQSECISDSTQPATDGHTCHFCQKHITYKGLSATIQCASCKVYHHVACLVNAYVTTHGAEKLKNSAQWLSDFLNAGIFRYRCQACTDKHAGRGLPEQLLSPSEQQLDIQLRKDISAIQATVSVISDNIAQLTRQLTEEQNNGSASQASMQHNSTSYCEVAAKDLHKVVQTAVSASIKEQQIVDRAKSSIVVYGFLEDGDDNRELRRMIDYLQCNCSILSHARIGYVANRDTKSARRPRPIKLELKSPHEVSLILNNANYLKEDEYYAGVIVSKWMSREELNNVKILRQQCSDLNKTHSADGRDRKPFFVYSGKLFERLTDRRVRLVKDPTEKQGLKSDAPDAKSKKVDAKSMKNDAKSKKDDAKSKKDAVPRDNELGAPSSVTAKPSQSKNA